MRKIGVYIALTCAVACVAVVGMKFAGSSSSVRGGIAVVDLDKVAAETGKSQEMRDALSLQQNSYNQELVTFTNQAKAVLEERASKINALDDKEEKLKETQEFQQIGQKANTILAQAKNVASNKLNQMYQVQIAKFRAELKPMVQEAAAKRGLSVVIPKNEGLLLSVEPGVDITDDVIKAYLAKRPAASAAAQTATPVPAAPVQAAAASRPTTEKAASEKATDDKASDEAPVPSAAKSKSKKGGSQARTVRTEETEARD